MFAYIYRMMRFINIRFPLYLHGMFGVVSFYSMFTLWQYVTTGQVHYNGASILGACTFVGMLLLLRIFDELKDVDADAKLFPDRPLQQGIISVADLKLAAVLLSLPMIIAHLLLWNSATIAFFVLFLFSILMYKWFFLPRLISKNILLALITHQPYIPLSYFYVISLAHLGNDYLLHMDTMLLLIFIFWLPFTVWELSRKIRAPGHETDYQTYSMMLGAHNATLICIGLLLIAGMLLTVLAITVDFSMLFLLIMAAVLVLVVGMLARFFIKPSPKTSQLEPYADTFLFILQLGILVDCLRASTT